MALTVNYASFDEVKDMHEFLKKLDMDPDDDKQAVTLLNIGGVGHTFSTRAQTDEQMREIGSMIEGARRYVIQPFIPKPDLPDPRFGQYHRTAAARLEHIEGLMRGYAEEIIVRGT